MNDLAEPFFTESDLFEVTKLIPQAKVPLIKLIHISTDLKCDIVSGNHTGIYNSDIIRCVFIFKCSSYIACSN